MLAARRAALARRLRTVKQLAGAAVFLFFGTLWIDVAGSQKKASAVEGVFVLGLLALLLLAAAGFGLWAWRLGSSLRDLDDQIEADKRANTSLADIFKREP